MLKHVFRYISGTVDDRLKFKKSRNGLKLQAYSDSDWASSAGRRSTTGYYFSLSPVGPALSWKSKKQPTVALSSCEAEYMALGLSTQGAIYLERFKDCLSLCQEPLLLYSDSQSALDLIKNPVNHSRCKHIDILHP